MPVFAYPGKLEEKNIKVTYFDAAGRAEAIRQTLFYGGIAFKDVRLTGAQWANLRPSTPYGQLPLLEVDGKTLAQSYAQLIYAGQLAGLYPEDAFQRAQVNELLFLGEDINTKLGPSFREQDPAKKKYLREKFVEELPQYIGYLERAVNENGSGKFLVGTSLSIADIAVAVLVNWLFGGAVDHVSADILDKFPKLKEFVDSVNSTPKLAEFKKTFEENKKNAKPTIKLTYFDTTGRAEAIRYAFHIAGIEFEDERLDYQQWGARKASTPFGQIPLLEVDGKVLTQSLAQLIYAGQLSGSLYPEDAVKRAKVNMALFATEDIYAKAAPAFGPGTDEEKKARREKLVEDLQPLLTSLDNLLGDKEYIAGELSIADLGLSQTLNFLTTRINHIPEDLLDKFPRLKAWVARVDANPKLAAYHKSQEGKPVFKL